MSRLVGVDIGSKYVKIATLDESSNLVKVKLKGQRFLPTCIYEDNDTFVIGNQALISGTKNTSDLYFLFTEKKYQKYTQLQLLENFIIELFYELSSLYKEEIVFAISISVLEDENLKNQIGDVLKKMNITSFIFVDDIDGLVNYIDYYDNTLSSFLLFDIGYKNSTLTYCQRRDNQYEIEEVLPVENLNGMTLESIIRYDLNNEYLKQFNKKLDEVANDVKLGIIVEQLMRNIIINNTVEKKIKTPDGTFTYRVTKNKFVLLSNPIKKNISDALDSIKENPRMVFDELNAVFLVGGQSSNPLIKSVLEETFESKLRELSDNDFFASYGAVLEAKSQVPEANFIEEDKTKVEENETEVVEEKQYSSDCFGMLIYDSVKNTVVNDVIFKQGEELPITLKQQYLVHSEKMKFLEFQFTKGCSENNDDITILEKKNIDLPHDVNVGDKFVVTYIYTCDSCVEVEVHNKQTNQIDKYLIDLR